MAEAATEITSESPATFDRDVQFHPHQLSRHAVNKDYFVLDNEDDEYEVRFTNGSQYPVWFV